MMVFKNYHKSIIVFVHDIFSTILFYNGVKPTLTIDFQMPIKKRLYIYLYLYLFITRRSGFIFGKFIIVRISFIRKKSDYRNQINSLAF